MIRKIAAFLTLLAFVIFDFGCVVRRTVREAPEQAWGKKTEVLGVLKKSGEYLEFSDRLPGKIIGDKIVGGHPGDVDLKVPRSDIKEIFKEGGTIKTIEKTDGTSLTVLRVIHEDETSLIVQTAYRGISIPLSEVDMLTVRRVDPGMTFLASVGIAGAILLGVGLVIALTKESCPFVYSWDGERFVFDAEPYGGSICEGLKRTDLCALDYLKEADGRYRLLVTNEVDETQNTDELKLVIVDHPPATQVVSDVSSNIHAISAPVSAIRAIDKKGRDLMPLVGAKDNAFWQTRESDIAGTAGQGWRDELVFEFPKRAGAKKARLVFNGCNTLWGSQMIKRVLELHGRSIGQWYEDVNRRGPSAFKAMAWSQREELYRLRLRVETERGWEPQAMMLGGGPLVSEDKIYDLDLSGVRGDVLRIKLTPPGGYWMINWLAVDFGEDSPCQVTELAPIEAVDGSGRDVRTLLTLEDRNYLSMPNMGDRAEVTFLAPPRRAGNLRSVFLKASGYYDIHLDAAGEPQTELLKRLVDEPGFILKYSAEQYEGWKKQVERRERTP